MSKRRKTGSFLDAAVAVLKAARGPLSTKEILARAEQRGLIATSGKTPERTLSSALYVDVLKNADSRFTRLAQHGKRRAIRNSVKWTLR
jgi:hypothetical protein